MVTESYLDDIADAIRAKKGTQDTYTPAEMADAIESISGGGITPTGTISITQNGTVDVTQYASADVNVPSVTPTGTISITQNGTVDVTNYASANVNVPNPSTGTKQISITQNGTTTEDVTNYASAEIAVNVPSNFTLIGQTTIALSEYTNTSTSETTDTGINISNTDYAWIYGVITCDSAITTSTEWGMSVFFGGRYTSNGKFFHGGALMQKGTATLSKAAMSNATTSASSCGVGVTTNTNNIFISRKCHATACPKIRAGNYTVKVYGMSAI